MYAKKTNKAMEKNEPKYVEDLLLFLNNIAKGILKRSTSYRQYFKNFMIL
jgi:hypothetical protein